jgi:HPt (histidine-containing phosphotransfer) domain-containing protein
VSDYENIVILDSKTLVNLQADTSRELVPVVVNMFIDETGERLPKIMQAWAERDYAVMENELHALKSGSGSFGVNRLYHIAMDAHELARNHDEDGLQQIVEQIQPVWVESLDALTHYLDSMD